jgi:plastocyanin
VISIAITLALAARARGAAGALERDDHPRAMRMSQAAMSRSSASWWASHPRIGTASSQVPATTFTIGNFFFDRDGNSATQVDTARIITGQSVLWQWAAGFHTITSGTGGTDPNAGTLFDQPGDSGHPQFTFTFNAAGTFPFFCRFHELSNMRGVVIVSNPADVGPISRWPLGFTLEPTPNPTTAGARFGFALRQSGLARAEVFDVRGRLVAVVLGRELAAGPHDAAWDGRTSMGTRASAGIYYLRLRLPGFVGSRRLVIAH